MILPRNITAADLAEDLAIVHGLPMPERRVMSRPEKYRPALRRVYRNSRRVEKLDIQTGEVVRTYDSLTLAADAMDLRLSTMRDVVITEAECMGFRWRYAARKTQTAG